MDRPAPLRSASRLVLVVAVLACVFGWSQTVAFGTSGAEVSSPPVTPRALPTEAAAGHSGSHPSAAAASMSAVTQAGHGGHGTQGDDAEGGSGHNWG